MDQVLLATMVTEECYKAGASYVELIWECGPINKLSYQYATAETLGTVQNWEEGAPQTDDRRSSGPHFH